MAEQTLSNGGAGGTLTFSNQINAFTLKTANLYTASNITLITKVTKAILNTTSGDTDHKSFQIQIPNGSPNSNILLTFTTNISGNTVVTGTNVTA